MISKTPERKVRDATASMLATHPFFGMLMLRMPIVEGSVETIAGDGSSLQYNPEWVAEATHDEIKGCIAHIVMGCALKHHTRRGERDYKKWQRASRMATAEILQRENFWVPDDVQAIDDAVERIYDTLPDDPKSDDAGGDAGGSGGETGGGQQDGADGEPSGETGGQQGDGSSTKPGDGKGDATPGEIQDAPADATDQQEADWDRAAQQAMQITKAQGKEPGNVEQVFEGAHDHFRHWTDVLREFMRATAPTDYTWSRPNRRLIDSGLYLPGVTGEGMGEIVIAIDTSGSVDDARVNRNCAEIFAIAEEVMPERVHVIQCDTRVVAHDDFHPLEAPSEITVKGRGGTKFQPVFDAVEEAGINPDVLIYLTDLRGPMPDEPNYPVVWAVEDSTQEARVPFGSSLVIE